MEYSIERINIDNKSLESVKALMEITFPGRTKFTMDYLKWQYVDNPLGYVYGYNAYYEGALAAHYATIPYRLLIDGVSHLGLLSLNTATHPEHRGKQLFTKLAEKTYANAAKDGYEFVIGVANDNSTHGFIKYLGFELITPLTFRVGFGAIAINPDCSYKCDLTRDFVEWRLSNPSNQYYAKGNTVFAKRSFFAKDIVGVVPVDFVPQKVLRSIWRPLNLYVGIGASLNHHYFKLPHLIKRPPFNLIFKSLGENKVIAPNKNNIVFQLLDFDVN